MNLYKKGFTLIELLVVISIIGLLSSIVLASLNDARKKAQYAQVKTTLIQLRNALEVYNLYNNAYPNQGSTIKDYDDSGTAGLTGTLSAGLSALTTGANKTISALPTYPVNGLPGLYYGYEINTDATGNLVKCGSQISHKYVLYIYDSNSTLKYGDLISSIGVWSNNGTAFPAFGCITL